MSSSCSTPPNDLLNCYPQSCSCSITSSDHQSVRFRYRQQRPCKRIRLPKVVLTVTLACCFSITQHFLPRFCASEAFVQGAKPLYGHDNVFAVPRLPRGGAASIAGHQDQLLTTNKKPGSGGNGAGRSTTKRDVLQTSAVGGPARGMHEDEEDEEEIMSSDFSDVSSSDFPGEGGLSIRPMPSFGVRGIPSSPKDLLAGDSSDIVEDDDDREERGVEAEAVPEAGEEVIIPTEYVAETHLPTDIGHYRLRAYRIPEHARHENQHVGNEPCVIYCYDFPPGRLSDGRTRGAVPVRIHDQCFTSEVFRSQRCDCKEQLQMSLKYVHEHGGAVIYLQQEGRGIGLANKVAAYALQDSGMDTVDANLHLGLPEDCRQYGVVPSILKDLGIDSILLMTNNPRKIERLRSLGVNVEGTIPMVVKSANKHNRRYLETKVSRMNHTDIGSMLDPSSETDIVGLDDDVMGAAAAVPRNLGMNGVMAPKARRPSLRPRPSPVVPVPVISEGLKTAANAVAQALLDEDPTQTGVAAKSDGYCFGRQSVLDAVAAIRRGELVVVVDDEDRENEGDFIIASDMVTPENMATMIRYTSGVLCVAMEGDRLEQLKLPSMVTKNEDPKGTAFTVSVDAAKKHGISTGISAADRAKTLQLLADPSTLEDDFVRPGHIFPLRARNGGTLERDGHTEAAVDLAKLAGRNPSGVLCEIVSEENPVEMARLPELKRFCKRHGFVMTSIVDIAQYRRETEDH